jgi:hypothetical protein
MANTSLNEPDAVAATACYCPPSGRLDVDDQNHILLSNGQQGVVKLLATQDLMSTNPVMTFPMASLFAGTFFVTKGQEKPFSISGHRMIRNDR